MKFLEWVHRHEVKFFLACLGAVIIVGAGGC